MDYIYKIEIQLFEQDGGYNANLLKKKKSDGDDKWRICACSTSSTLDMSFELAEEMKNIYKE